MATNEVFRITKKDIDADGNYKCSDKIETDLPIEIDENLGYVKIKLGVCSKKYIIAKAGSGIKAGWGIKAGSGIEAGSGIITFFGNIIAKFISCLRICVGFHSTKIYTITAEIRKGDVILGKVEKPKKE